MATEGRSQVEVNDQEETVLSTHARAAELAKAVQEAQSEIAARSGRRRKWIAIAVAVVLVGSLVVLLS